MKKYKLAIVENDEDERFFMADAFNAFKGFDIIGEFSNGDQLFEWLNGQPDTLPELILSDLNMPGKNGYDVITGVKANFPQIPVIITSTSSVSSTREKCVGLGAREFMVKPDIFIAYDRYAENLYKLISDDEDQQIRI
ncbi:response regulator transcription factor [Dyadobacter sp. Leaf189]|uniref:response regulator transcription factor n=1 Tax=Dyadobacter sp. Leaf189 TaxID=1736295 RepID=UPI0006F80052|nr:response regulator [Dyadobacter sp. Leaf189]KQS27107.1 response regulator receiver protein [Dyadobacter sp. Leaf189]